MVGQKPPGIEEIMKIIKEPKNLGSFYKGESAKPMKILVHRSATEVKELTVEEPYPFLTLQDLKLSIYSAFEKSERAAPEYQFLAIEVGGKSYKRYDAVDFIWAAAGTTNEIHLVSPFDEKVGEQSIDFVDEVGERRSLSYTSRQRVLFETFQEEVVAPLGGSLQLHLFLYDDLVKGKEMTQRLWNGSIYPYFPLLSFERNEVNTKRLKMQVQKYERTVQFVNRVQGFLQEELSPISLGGVRELKFLWIPRANQREDNFSIESVFYTSPVSSFRPYMRLIPAKGTAVTKIHLLKDGQPDFSDTKLLKLWTRERNPNPESQFVLAKCLIKPAIAQQNPLYMTLRLHADESAEAIVLPPRGVRKLDMVSDLDNFVENFKKGLDKLPYMEYPLSLHEASLIYGIHLPAKSQTFTKKVLRKRLPLLSPFFQEIDALPGEQPLATLRYKFVDNFATEDKIFTFLKQLAARKIVQGEALLAELVPILEDEFQLDTEEAKGYVARWFKNKGDFSLVSAETKTYIETNNTGILVSIFPQHPFYSFHIHNVDSTKNLQRILTLLSVLFSNKDFSFGVPEKAVTQLKVEEVALEPPTEEEVVLDDYFLQMAAADEEETKSVAERVEEDAVEPEEELASTPIAASEEESSEPEGTGLADFFLTKLKEADKRLFDYTKTHPSLKKYVSMCAANVTRQPAVISRAQFENMRTNIYKDDLAKGRINFHVFPRDGVPPKKAIGETFYFLQYGTNQVKYNQNYYVCSKYFCTRDNIIVIEADFLGTVLRRPVKRDEVIRTKKAPNTCPFCEGAPIRNRRSPGLNETVIVRQEAPKTKDMYHTYVGFLKKTPHPEGFYLPCCFLKPMPITLTDRYFDKLKQSGIDLRPGMGLEDREPVDVPDIPAAVVVAPADELRAIKSKQSYQTVMYRVSTKYIVGSEKLPLEIDEEEGPQVGLLPPVLDKFFNQDISNFLSPKNPHKLKEDAKGFLRIGVENRVRFKADSFLAAIAPFYQKESAKEMKQLLWHFLNNNPAIYFQLNYGNFLIEFYVPADDRPTDSENQHFLESDDVLSNRWTEAIQLPGYSDAKKRFQMSMENFHRVLFSDTKGKEYRQFASLLAQPNVILRAADTSDIPGITFIVLHINPDNTVTVQCPPYGFNPSIHANNDVAFLLHHHSGVWEPIFHVDNRSKTDPTSLLFQAAEKSLWPPSVKQRVEEYMSESGCFTRGKYSYGSRYTASPQRMIPCSVLYAYFQKKKVGLEGILRDPYNHLAALVVQDPENPSHLICVPCADDGYILPTTKIYLDWTDVFTAETETILEFYQTYMTPFSVVYGSFKPKQVWYTPEIKPRLTREKGKVVAILLENNALIPVNVDYVGDDELEPATFKKEAGNYFFSSPQGEIPAFIKSRDQLEWEINKKVFFSRQAETPEETDLSPSEVSEIYEHFRITFANWLNLPGNSAVRKEIQEIIFDLDNSYVYKSKLYEKRKRLQILLESRDILEWLSSEETEGEPSVQRVDCTSIQKETCSGRCVWSSAGEECLIHSPEEIEVGGVHVNAARLFMYRVIEELLRFSEKRQELLQNTVSQIGAIEKAMIRGEEYILPENTTAWYEFLRGEWIRDATEKPRYHEEMSVKPKESIVQLTDENELPTLFKTWLGEDPKAATFRILRAETITQLFSRLSYPVSSEKLFTSAELEGIARITKYPIAQIDLRSEDVPALAATPFSAKDEYFVLLYTEEGPAVLLKDPTSDTLPSFAQLPKKIKELFQANPPKKAAPRIVAKKTVKQAVAEKKVSVPVAAAPVAAAPFGTKTLKELIAARNASRV